MLKFQTFVKKFQQCSKSTLILERINDLLRISPLSRLLEGFAARLTLSSHTSKLVRDTTSPLAGAQVCAQPSPRCIAPTAMH